MKNLKLKLKKISKSLQTVTAGLLILCGGINAFAQYKGAPVQKSRLIKVLRSKSLQTRDIVTVINNNGVDFKITPEIRKALIAAGARPEVIQAAESNPRLAVNSLIVKNNRRNSPRTPNTNAPTSYDDLIEQAISSFKEKQDTRSAVRYLETAVKMKPKSPAAYQMLGFVSLYGLNDAARADRLMHQAIENGGSAVFRVFHDDNGKFTHRCTGSLYISPENIRFESDDNRHTFETSTVNVDKFKLDRENTREWKNRSIFKIFLKIGSDKARFRFAPITGKEEESKMVDRFVAESKLENLAPTTAGIYLD